MLSRGAGRRGPPRRRRGAEQLLEVVEDQEHGLPAEVPRECLERRLVRRLARAEGLHDRREHKPRYDRVAPAGNQSLID